MKTFNQIKSGMALLVALLACTLQGKTAQPAWTVNADSFQYNMTMMATINAECAELVNPANRIGVFVNGVCRGTAQTKQVVNGRFMASLFIYSNVVSGETVSFKIYDAGKDSVYDAKLTVAFQENASYGTASSPYVVYSKYPCYFQKDVLPVNNFISPNGDGVNDYFVIDDVDSYKDYTLTIYNEFGLELFKVAREYKNDWNAMYDGKALPTGAYYYTFRNDKDGKEYKGILNIVKVN